jgi:hypothetical protein
MTDDIRDRPERYRRAARKGMEQVRAALDEAKKNSVRPTLRAREEAFRHQQAVQRQRDAAPPVPLPPDDAPEEVPPDAP